MIDNSSLYRYDPDVPLIVPEVNPEAIHGYSKKNIIANPNCSTAQMVDALKPLHDRATINELLSAHTNPYQVQAKRVSTSCGTKPSRSTTRQMTSHRASSPSRSRST